MVNAKDAAKIMLRYDYPVWKVLEREAPDDMWDDLAKEFGLEEVTDVDI